MRKESECGFVVNVLGRAFLQAAMWLNLTFKSVATVLGRYRSGIYFTLSRRSPRLLCTHLWVESHLHFAAPAKTNDLSSRSESCDTGRRDQSSTVESNVLVATAGLHESSHASQSLSPIFKPELRNSHLQCIEPEVSLFRGRLHIRSRGMILGVAQDGRFNTS